MIMMMMMMICSRPFCPLAATGSRHWDEEISKRPTGGERWFWSGNQNESNAIRTENGNLLGREQVPWRRHSLEFSSDLGPIQNQNRNQSRGRSINGLEVKV